MKKAAIFTFIILVPMLIIVIAYTRYVSGKNKIVERVIRQLDVWASRRFTEAGSRAGPVPLRPPCTCGNVRMIALTGLQIYSDEGSRKLCEDCVFSISAR